MGTWLILVIVHNVNRLDSVCIDKKRKMHQNFIDI